MVALENVQCEMFRILEIYIMVAVNSPKCGICAFVGYQPSNYHPAKKTKINIYTLNYYSFHFVALLSTSNHRKTGVNRV